MVTFGLHDLLKDPPFSRLDLISCRNLLTYFDCEARRHSLEIFRYALWETGLLFLGSAEPIEEAGTPFILSSQESRLYTPRSAK